MKSHADKTQENKSQDVANNISRKKSENETTFQFLDIRRETVAQRKLQEMANNNPQVSQLKAFQKMANNYSAQQLNGKVNVNNDVGLEKEADVMGMKAMNNGEINSVGVIQPKLI